MSQAQETEVKAFEQGYSDMLYDRQGSYSGTEAAAYQRGRDAAGMEKAILLKKQAEQAAAAQQGSVA